MSMDFDEYQEATMETAIYPEAGEGTELALAYVALGLGEVGEVQGKIKKIIRDSAGQVSEEHVDAIKKELGDVLWYSARLCDELDISLESVAALNINKLQSRKQRGVIGGSGDNR